MTEWAYDEDRTYHGVEDPETGETRIEVERAEFGPTQRSGVIVLRVLPPADSPSLKREKFAWGWVGGGPRASAWAVLADALGQKPSPEITAAFAQDFMSQFSGEWRLRRGAILRWARGWCAQNNVDVLPVTLRNLPPTDPSGYAELPDELEKQRIERITGKPHPRG
ncbi:DUF6166 domain-containing protein (plasmid) [Streptosporangium sandarakinum]|uniref:DUF6166 domain-containing protein n=1 Tax=Streptosporangium sandarakinum TaxID=1260955 RepID=UPI003D8F36E0